MSNSNKPIRTYLILAITGWFVAVLLNFSTPAGLAELSNRDFLMEFRGELSLEDTSIVLLAISETADDEIPEKWPWPLDLHARLVENLNRAGAKAILFDVLFTQPDIYNPANDSLFAETLQKFDNVVLAGDVVREARMLSEQPIPIFPIPLFREANTNEVGFVNTTPYADGVIRSYPLAKVYKEQVYFMLGLEGLRVYQGLPSDAMPSLEQLMSEAEVQIGTYTIDRSAKNAFLINFYGPEGIFPTYSFDEVIDDTSYSTVMEREAFEMNRFEDPSSGTGLLYDGVFKDKIVIVGSTMPSLQDFKLTPFASAEVPRPGFEVHAHAIQTILDENFLGEQSDIAAIALMLLAALLIAGIHRYLGAIWGFVAVIVLTALYYLICMFFFLQQGLFLNVMGVTLSLFSTQVISTAYDYVFEQREKRRIKGMFSSYVSPKLVEQMVESGDEPTLGGEEQVLTAFFSDIVAFSTFSEQLEANKLVELINEYLTAMSELINEQDGTLDKFIGDAIVAFYGAPVTLENHAYRACKTSQLMQKKLSELRAKWKAEGWPELVYNMQQRIGVNTGPMVTGNMGSVRRFNYTMMGDNVNLAARCESGAKQYHIFTMVTEATKVEAEKYGNDLVFRQLDNIVVKGRSKPVNVYEIVCLKEDASESTTELINIFEEGLKKYFKGEWEQAITIFRRSEQLEPNKPNPSLVFIDRCEYLLKNHPGTDWDGVFRMSSK